MLKVGPICILSQKEAAFWGLAAQGPKFGEMSDSLAVAILALLRHVKPALDETEEFIVLCTSQSMSMLLLYVCCLSHCRTRLKGLCPLLVLLLAVPRSFARG